MTKQELAKRIEKARKAELETAAIRQRQAADPIAQVGAQQEKERKKVRAQQEYRRKTEETTRKKTQQAATPKRQTALNRARKQAVEKDSMLSEAPDFGQWKAKPESRLESTVKGALGGTLSGLTNLAGAGVDTASKIFRWWETDKQNYAARTAKRLRSDLESGKNGNGAQLTPAQRAKISAAILANQNKAEQAKKSTSPVARVVRGTRQKLERTAQGIYRTADKIAEEASKSTEQAKLGLGKLGKFGVDVGTAGIQMGVDAAMGGLPAMFARSAGSAAQTARQSGAGFGDQLAYGLTSGALATATEKMFSAAQPLRKAFGKGVLDDAVEKAAGKLAQSAAGRVALSALEEGSEEFVEDVFQPVLQRTTYDPKARFDLSGALYDAAIGAAMGGLASGPAAIQAGRQNVRQWRADAREQRHNAREQSLGDSWTRLAQQDAGDGAMFADRPSDPLTNAGQALDTMRNFQRSAQDTEQQMQTSAMDQASTPAEQQRAAQEAEAAPLKAGRVTTIQHPYQGTVPVQTQKSAAAPLEVDSALVRTAENRIKGARNLEQSGMAKFKATLKNACKEVFHPAKGVLVEGVSFDGTPYAVDINSKVLGKVISDPNVSAEKLALLEMLPDLVRRGEYVGSGEYVQHGSKNKTAIRYDYFETPVVIGGKSYIAAFDVEAYPTVNNYRTHRLIEIDLLETEGRLVGPAPTATPAPAGPLEQTIAQDSEVVNPELSAEPAHSDGEVGPNSVGAERQGKLGQDDFTLLQMQARDFHPIGPNAEHQVPVPTKDFVGRNVPKSASTAMGAKALDQDSMEQLAQQIASGELSFDTIRDTDATARAQRTIAEKSFDGALEQYRNAVDSNTATKDNTCLGQQLLIMAIDGKNAAAVSELLSLYTRNSTNLAQAMQAQSIFRKLDPETQLLAVQRAIDAFNRKHNADVEMDPEDVKDFMDAKTDEERDAAKEKILKNAGKQCPKGFIAKLDLIRYLNMLGNTRTHIRNIFGNAFFQIPVAAKNRVGAVLEGIEYVRTGGKFERTKTLFGSNPARKLTRECFADFENAASFLSGQNMASEGKGEVIPQPTFSNKHLPGRAANWLGEKNSGLLSAEDMAAKKIIYGQSLAGYLRANKCKSIADASPELLARARNYAAQEASRNTFNDKNMASDAVSRLSKAKYSENPVIGAGSFLVEGLLPFKRTPVNIYVRALEYSPVGLLIGGVERIRGAAMKVNAPAEISEADAKKMTPEERSAAEAEKLAAQQRAAEKQEIITRSLDRLAAGITGTALMAAGFWLAGMGSLTGGDDEDEKQRGFDALNGRQTYALQMKDGTSVTLNWLAPEAVPLFMGVELYNATRDGGLSFQDAYRMIGNATSPMLEMTVLEGLSDAFDNAAYAKNNGGNVMTAFVATAALNYLTQLVPTAAGQLERSTEDKRMTTFVTPDSWMPKGMQRTLGKISQKIPGWDFQQIPYIDAWGREQPSGDPLVRTLNNTLNPAYLSKDRSGEVEKELQRLYDETADGGLFPQRAEVTVKYTVKTKLPNGDEKSEHKEKIFTQKEYVKFAKDLGQTSYRAVSDAMKTSQYKSMSNGEKADYLNLVYQYAEQTARAKAIPDYPLETRTVNAQNAQKDLGVSPVEYLALYQQFGSGIMSGKAYETTLKAVKEGGLTVGEYAAYKMGVKDLKGDKDADGKTVSGSKKKKVVAAIAALPLSPTEKDWLYLMNGYTKKDIGRLPWR